MVQKVLLILGGVVLALVAAFYILAALVPKPDVITYGVTFSEFRAQELQLPWKEVFDAIVDDLGVRHLRLVAHWQLTEPAQGEYDFSALDYQMRRAEETNSTVILAVGRRLPSWPECHLPLWVQSMSVQEESAALLAYITKVVNRYKDSPALKWWQVENEPFIWGFALAQCGKTDSSLLDEEIALVRSLDPDHPILLTASGEIGEWFGTARRGDAFGTTMYRHIWNSALHTYVTYPLPPVFYRAKWALTALLSGSWGKPAIIAELAAEPWVPSAVVGTSLTEQLSRMNIDRLDESVAFAAQTGFSEQYLWGAEWWYYLKTVHESDEIWKWAQTLFAQK